MKTSSRTFQWIAATLSAALLLGPLAPTVAHACAGMNGSEMSGNHAASPSDRHTSSGAHTSSASERSKTAPVPAPTHHAHAPTEGHEQADQHEADQHEANEHQASQPNSSHHGAEAAVSSSTSHTCMGPCAGSDCCSMRAAPISQADVFVAERAQPISVVTTGTALRPTALFPRADRAPPRPHQPEVLPSLLSARLHVWMATFLT